jgi:AcrR family transcriptional regulator
VGQVNATAVPGFDAEAEPERVDRADHPSGSDELRARLVEAAAEVFAEKGYERAGVQEIARRAGLTTGAIYSRFTGKAELLAEAISAESGSQLGELFAPPDASLDAAEVIRRVGVQLLPRPATRKQGLLLEAFIAARRDPEVEATLRARLADTRQVFARLVDLGCRKGDLDPSLDTGAVVHFCQAVAFGFLVFDTIESPTPDPSGWADLITRLVAALVPADDPT